MVKSRAESLGGLIKSVERNSVAASLGVRNGDVLLAVNGEKVDDVIDVQFYAAEYEVELQILREGQKLILSGQRREGQLLGLEFEHPTFDIDIRRCNNLCEFCFVLQMAPRMRRTLYIKDDDYRYSFLFGHFVTLTNLSGHDEWRIVNQHLSPLYVSVHATDLELRRKCLRNPAAPAIMRQLRRLIDEGIKVHSQIVVTPELNDGPHLEKTVADLASMFPGVQSVCVVPVGLTQHHKYGMRPNNLTECNAVLDACHIWQEAYKARLGSNFVYPTDEWYLTTGRSIPPLETIEGLDLWANGLGMVHRFIDDWESVKIEPPQQAVVRSVTLVTGALFAPTLSKAAAEFEHRFDVGTEVIPVINKRLGETITVAGLLMGADVISQLQGQKLGEVVALPRLMFDHPSGTSLDDISPMDIARELGRPVALLDMMGDLVDVIHGRPALFFDPARGNTGVGNAIQSSGSWAVEKNL